MLLTRYTFVNTLERMKPLVLDWAAPLPNNKERKAAGAQPPALAASSSASARVLQPSTKFAAAAVALPPTAYADSYADSYFRYPLYKAHPQDAAASVPASGTWAAAAAAAALNGPAKGRAPLDVRHSAAAASKKRNAFLTRMSRRVARNMAAAVATGRSKEFPCSCGLGGLIRTSEDGLVTRLCRAME